jgi:hypothetical protein
VRRVTRSDSAASVNNIGGTLKRHTTLVAKVLKVLKRYIRYLSNMIMWMSSQLASLRAGCEAVHPSVIAYSEGILNYGNISSSPG